MKFEWDADDIKPGIMVGKPGRIERWMIGYASFAQHEDAKYTLNSLTDGMVNGTYTKAELAERLTRNNDHPVDVLDNSRFGFRTPTATS